MKAPRVAWAIYAKIRRRSTGWDKGPSPHAAGAPYIKPSQTCERLVDQFVMKVKALLRCSRIQAPSR